MRRAGESAADVRPRWRWVEEFPGSVTVCDASGVIVEMNERSARMFREEGGRALIGSSVLACHPEPARSKLAEMMRERRANSYTTEKKGVRRFVHQSPWYEQGEYAGFVEIVVEIPADLPHFVRR